MKKPHDTLGCHPGCPVEATLNLIGGKWKGIILYHLLIDDVLRFNAFLRLLPSINQRMLTKQLRELEASGLILRTVYPVIPPKVEYTLTPLGKSLKTILMSLKDWGTEHGLIKSRALAKAQKTI